MIYLGKMTNGTLMFYCATTAHYTKGLPITCGIGGCDILLEMEQRIQKNINRFVSYILKNLTAKMKPYKERNILNLVRAETG